MSYPEILPVDQILPGGALMRTGPAYPEMWQDANRWVALRDAIVAGNDEFMRAIEGWHYRDPDNPTADELDAVLDSLI